MGPMKLLPNEAKVNEMIKKQGVPLGAIVSFPNEITNPRGFLKCDGSTFSQETLP